jgi:outer membrane protein assembly factor BamB
MRRTVVVLLALLLLPACASRSVREPPAPLADLKPELQVRELWSVDVGASAKQAVFLAPAVAEGVVYMADPEGRVSAHAADTGERMWNVDLDTRISGATGVGEGLVLVGSRQGDVIAIQRESGKQAWKARVSSEVLSAPSAAAGIVVVQTVDGKVFGLAASDGKRLWVYERAEPALTLRGTATPAIVNDVVLTGFASGRIAALRLQDGKLLWEVPITQPRGRNEIERLVDVDASPLVLGETIYSASYQGKVVALNPRGGSIVWSRDASTYRALATDGRNIYLSDDRGHVLAFDARSGASVWKQDQLRGREPSAPVVQGDYLMVGDFEGYVHWLAREDGRLLARHRVDGAVRAPAVASGDTVYVAGLSGTLSALRLLPH